MAKGAVLLWPKRIYGISQRRFDGLVADGQQRNEEHDQGRVTKNTPWNLYSVGKILQPFVHKIIGNEDGNERQFYEIFR